MEVSVTWRQELQQNIGQGTSSFIRRFRRNNSLQARLRPLAPGSDVQHQAKRGGEAELEADVPEDERVD